MLAVLITDSVHGLHALVHQRKDVSVCTCSSDWVLNGRTC